MPRQLPPSPATPPTIPSPAGRWLRGALAVLAIGVALTPTAPAQPAVSMAPVTPPTPLTAPVDGAASVSASVSASAEPAVTLVRLPAEPGMPALTAYWFTPREGSLARSQPLPVVVALHGCGGLVDMRVAAKRAGTIEEVIDPAAALQSRYREYAHWLTERGYAVLMPDSFSPRGKAQGICTEALDARAIDDRTRRADALAALRWVARQPIIDTRRIVLLGWSNGAQAVLATIDASRPWPSGTPTVDRAVAFYPGCKRAVQQHDFRLRTPLLLLIGGADDWTPATRCAMLQNAVQSRQPGARFRLEIYPGAYHGFDGTSELHVRRDIAARHGTGVTVGGDAVARVAALAQLDSWLASPDP
ncbi:dienelactone hydrolase family protein [Cupriavidus agavae]|uniref:Dienelactone hydrolase n=1 Tax=Cupriavidus agavae TaxID=1001822 RepID=A0A4Q7RX82_9BURK|nr:dienelactone hydrolase family protein [Cupriavidus agavae]RZT38505.1 dienelactone hydrolase [Cupriavidus agavae]